MNPFHDAHAHSDHEPLCFQAIATPWLRGARADFDGTSSPSEARRSGAERQDVFNIRKVGCAPLILHRIVEEPSYCLGSGAAADVIGGQDRPFARSSGRHTSCAKGSRLLANGSPPARLSGRPA